MDFYEVTYKSKLVHYANDKNNNIISVTNL